MIYSRLSVQYCNGFHSTCLQVPLGNRQIQEFRDSKLCTYTETVPEQPTWKRNQNHHHCTIPAYTTGQWAYYIFGVQLQEGQDQVSRHKTSIPNQHYNNFDAR